MTKKLTEEDERVLKLCPDGWFESDDLFPQVKRASYRCDRLCEAGKLEWSTKGPITDLQRIYRKII